MFCIYVIELPADQILTVDDDIAEHFLQNIIHVLSNLNNSFEKSPISIISVSFWNKFSSQQSLTKNNALSFVL